MKKCWQQRGATVYTANAYDRDAIRSGLKQALSSAEEGKFVTFLLDGRRQVQRLGQGDSLQDRIKQIAAKAGPKNDLTVAEGSTSLHLNGNQAKSAECSSHKLCHHGYQNDSNITNNIGKTLSTIGLFAPNHSQHKTIPKESLPAAIRVAIRGLVGQDLQFFGDVLAEVFSKTPYMDTNIIKGENPGLKQPGVPMMTTFSCGDVSSPVLQKGTVDVLVAMEISELLRPGFIELLKPGGTILLNDYIKKPSFFAGNYPDLTEIESKLSGYKIIKMGATKMSNDLGDDTGKTSNIVMLGALSKVVPFNCIPRENWLAALSAFSSTETIFENNYAAFQKGEAMENRISSEVTQANSLKAS